MKTIQETRDWLLANRVNEHGRLDLEGLDFSDFDGNVNISKMKVKRNLYQMQHEVCGDLNQEWHKVGKDLYQSGHTVGGDLSQSGQDVEGNLKQCHQVVKGYVHIGGDDFAGIAEFVDWKTKWKIIKEK